MNSFEEINAYLLKKLESDEYYAKQLETILKSDDFLIDYEFLGFVDTYYHLSCILPRGRVIYDMGCGPALHSLFFRNHRKYIGIDFEMNKNEVLMTPNSEFFNCTIAEFIKEHEIEEPHFAICNYVPPWGSDNMELVRESFKHMYVFYPEKCDDYSLSDITTTFKKS